MNSNARHPVPACNGNDAGWFQHKGVYYFENRYPGEKPIIEGQMFHTVSYIKDGKIIRVCEANFRSQVKAEQGTIQR